MLQIAAFPIQQPPNTNIVFCNLTVISGHVIEIKDFLAGRVLSTPNEV